MSEPREMEVVRADQSIVRAEDFMPLMSVAQAVDRKRQINQFIGGVLIEGEDYGKIPGGQQKPVLLKPGAEKLSSIFGLAPRYVAEEQVEDWTGRDHGGEPLFYYRYRCQLYRGDRFMGEAVGSANSWEAKHRYRWMREDQLTVDKTGLPVRGGKQTLFEPFFAMDKKETTGQYGKPVEHWARFEAAIVDGSARKVTKKTRAGKDMTGWEIDVDATMYRVPNPDSADVVNTCQKMAQKRALVAAVLVVTNCSDAFTQDLEDADPGAGVDSIDTGGHPVGTKAASDHVRDQKIKEGETPKELQAMLDSIQNDTRAFKQCHEKLASAMSDKAGSDGAKAYDAWATAVSDKHPNGTGNKAVLQAHIRDLYKLYQELKAPAEPPVEPAKSLFDEHMKEPATK